MDVLKQKLNDIGVCIGYPFYFFEDGSYSKSIVNGKMNAMIIVKRSFLSGHGGISFVSDDAAQKLRENASFVPKSSEPLDWFKKNVNDIGDCICYPYYILDDGTCVGEGEPRKKVAVVIVRKPFLNIYGESDKLVTKNFDLVKPCFQSVTSVLDKKSKSLLPQRVDDDRTREVYSRILSSSATISYGISDDDLLYMIRHGQIEAVKQYCMQGIANKTYDARSDKYFSRYFVFAKQFPKTIEEIVKLHDFELFKYFMADKKACYLCADFVYAYGTLDMLDFILTDTGRIDALSHPTILIEKNNGEGYRLFCHKLRKKHSNLLDEYYCLVRKMKYDLFRILLEEEFLYTGEFTRDMFINLVRIDDNCSTLIQLVTGKVSQEFLDMLRE